MRPRCSHTLRKRGGATSPRASCTSIDIDRRKTLAHLSGPITYAVGYYVFQREFRTFGRFSVLLRTFGRRDSLNFFGHAEPQPIECVSYRPLSRLNLSRRYKPSHNERTQNEGLMILRHLRAANTSVWVCASRGRGNVHARPGDRRCSTSARLKSTFSSIRHASQH